MFKKNLLLASFILLISISVFYACKSVKNAPPTVATAAQTPRILVFSKTAGFYHDAIPEGTAAIMKLGKENNFLVDSTKDARYFNEDSLKKYSVVIFLSTTMNVLNADQQVAFQRFIQAGGGFVGVHAAADTEYDWPWYNQLVGAYFLNHPRQQKAVIDVKDKTHISTSFLPTRWERFDEWYSYKSINPAIKVLATLDETTYEGGLNGDDHPIAWYHEFDGGRSFYTGLGHTKESYVEPLFLQHLLGGIKYAIGNNKMDYSKAYAVKAPEDNRFTKTVLTNDLNEPMELTVAPDGRVFFTERSGKFYVYDPAIRKTRLLYNFPTKAVEKYLNGLIGITLDPDFNQNKYIYFFYSSNTGEQYHQNVSRYKIMDDGNLDTLSEKIIIKIPIDLEVSAHTGGSLAWDKYKNLYISTGDNTVPFESHGYAPLDEREGRKVYDAQRSAGNANDLRGKILRIHPEADGSYTIPEGNLFAKGTAGTRPEIYVMGCRNPYRIAVDTATSIVYWGEVGPDAGQDSRHGPRGYDEFNQAKKPGNFGWPYFVGNTIAYNDSDFATKAIGALFDASGPTNNSPNNTGIKTLPPPQAPMVFYPYAASEKFPSLGQGGRCAMGGPIYHYNAALASERKLPAYYDKAFFVYDWMRNWVFAVHMDENSNYKRLDQFMPTNGDFRRPVDIEFGPDGAIYMLEYGSVYGIDNADARLVRIDYNNGNRAPVAVVETRDTVGLAPHKVTFSARKSYDFDEEPLRYEWTLNGQKISDQQNPVYTFADNGIYKPVLKITDAAGQSSTDTVEIKVGNTLPSVAINAMDNSSFFFPFSTALKYDVAISDKEDPSIDKKNVRVALKYIPKVADTEPLVGHQQMDENYNLGKNMVAASDCKACHQVNAKSVGPSFMDVSKKYSTDKNAIGYLSNKIIVGGGGVWGEHAMSAHPQISKEDAEEIVKYVLSVSTQQEEVLLPQVGQVLLNQHAATAEEGRYLLTASYTDKGGAVTPLTRKETLVLRASKVQAESADVVYNMQKGGGRLNGIHNGSYFVLKNIDLKDVSGITYRYASANKDGTLEVRMDNRKGQVLSTFNFKATGRMNTFKEELATITDPGGKHDLYFAFVKSDTPNKNLASLDWLRFEGGKEVVMKNDTVPKKAAVEKKVPAKASPSKTAAVKTATAHPGYALVTKSDCMSCHKVDQKLVGPSFTQVANRYKNQPAAVNKLAGKIINGGAGVWGQIPMAPHPQMSKADATKMVQYILSIK
ncbi:MAG TPA: ThuA domain-containing protein [Chitinophagaceae bacterium]|nr:ThuA domain-containing protein [Chitinophagaceae bacterium]